jgi:hypothetical protein
MNKEEILKLVRSKYVHQIRAGDKHRFIDITVIEMSGRYFVRQYKFGERSWRDAFLEDPKGEIKIGNVVIPIEGRIPQDLDIINPKINWAFHKKLPLIYFLMRLTYNTKKHEASTIELIPQV